MGNQVASRRTIDGTSEKTILTQDAGYMMQDQEKMHDPRYTMQDESGWIY